MADDSPLHWPIAALRTAFRDRRLSPVEVATLALERIEQFDPLLHAFLSVSPDLTLLQAQAAERAHAGGDEGPLLGIPVSVKDAFHMRGVPTTFGSLIHVGQLSLADSGVVARLRAAGAVFTGKTNTAEFGQSAVTENRLGAPTANPWDLGRTPGGSSGGAAASVAAALSCAAVGSDGGGSVRIPAAFTGLFGFKPTSRTCRDEGGFRAMSEFVSPGTLTSCVEDARLMIEVLSGQRLAARPAPPGMRIGWCPRPEGRPVEPGVQKAVGAAVACLEQLGHHVVEIDLPVNGWQEIFGPLVLAEEHRERGHLLPIAEGQLTSYERNTLRAATRLDPDAVSAATDALDGFRTRLRSLFDEIDLIATPAVAVTAFPLGQRPVEIDGQPVDALWGAFPFAAPFNVAGAPAASLPCSLVDGLPVGLQLVACPGADALLLDTCAQIEQAIPLDRHTVRDRWSAVSTPAAER